VLTLIGVRVLLTASQVIVTQYIRVRAVGRITRSQDAVRVLKIEDLPRRRRDTRPAGRPPGSDKLFRDGGGLALAALSFWTRTSRP